MGCLISSSSAESNSAIRQRGPNEVPKMFKDVACPFPTASTYVGRFGAVNYSLEGPENGELVVCLHGLNASRTMWKPIGEALAKKGYRVLNFDMYGHGLSNNPPVSLCGCPCGRRKASYDLNFFVDQLEDLLEGLQLVREPMTLFGFSMGGAIAAAYARRFPQRVIRLALLSPAGCVPHLPWIYYLLKALWCILLPLANRCLCACFYKKEKWAKGLEKEDPEVVHQMWSRLVWTLFIKRGTPSAQLAVTLRVPWAGQERLFKDVGSHPRPVLLIWGDGDTLNPIDIAQKVNRFFTNSYLLVIKDAKHIVHSDQAQCCYNALLSFLKMPSDCDMKKVSIGQSSSLVLEPGAGDALLLKRLCPDVMLIGSSAAPHASLSV